MFLVEKELKSGPFSSWTVTEKIRNSKIAIKYQNVNAKIRNLEKLGLLERLKPDEVSDVRSVHNAKYYRISLNGWFNLILDGKFQFLTVQKVLIKYYDSNALFKNIFSIYFAKSTIESMVSGWSLFIFPYLEDSCRLILNIVTSLKNQAYEVLQSIKSKSDNNVRSSENGENLLQYINHRLDLQAKTFVMQLLSMRRITNPDVEESSLRILAKDKKFMLTVKDAISYFDQRYRLLNS